MNADEIAILNRTFVILIPFADLAPRLFQDRLLVLEPELRTLAVGSIPLQTEVLAKLLAHMIQALGHPDQGERVARYVGFRYSQVGLEPRHYPSIVESMIWAFRHLLGDSLGTDEELAWRNGFAVLARHMEAGAKQASQPLNNSLLC